MLTEDLGIGKRLGRGKIRNSRSRSLGTKLTHEEEKEMVRAAESQGKSASEWAREVLLREARKSNDSALFTEIVAIRMLLVNLIEPLALGQKLTREGITDVMAKVRKDKHIAAREVMQQYLPIEAKES